MIPDTKAKKKLYWPDFLAYFWREGQTWFDFEILLSWEIKWQTEK